MFLTDHELSLGEQIVGFVDWLTLHGASFFDKISDILGFLIHGVTNGLLWLDLLALIALLVGLVRLIQRSWGLTVFAPASSLLILSLGYWRETMETLARVIFATLVCIAVGVPLGVAAVHKPRFYIALRSLPDLMQTAPTFVYLISAPILFGLDVMPGLISMVVLAVVAPICLICLGIRDVPAELLDAGKAFGCPCWQLLTHIKLPHAMPSIAVGIIQCIMLSLPMVAIAALVGVDGLGKLVVNALGTADISLDFEASLTIVLLAILLDRACKQRVAKGK